MSTQTNLGIPVVLDLIDEKIGELGEAVDSLLNRIDCLRRPSAQVNRADNPAAPPSHGSSFKNRLDGILEGIEKNKNQLSSALQDLDL